MIYAIPSSVVFAITFIFILLGFSAADRRLKKEYCFVGVYKLNKLKKFFIYFERGKGEITKFVFWCHMALFFSLILFIIAWILLITNRQTMWLRSTQVLGFTPLIIAFVASLFFGFYYKAKKEKIKKQQEQEAYIQNEKERREWIKNRALQRQEKENQQSTENQNIESSIDNLADSEPNNEFGN